MIRIITDSASDYDQKLAQENGIIVIPMMVQFNETSYRDGIDLSAKEFYKKLKESDTIPKTSQIPPQIFSETFREVTEKGDEAIVIVVSSELSGTYQSACLAASEYDNIRVIDSKNVTIGEQCLIAYARRRIQEKASLDQISKELNELRDHIKVLALLETLEYLKKGGRISKTAAFAGGILSIRPVVSVVDGKVAAVGKARGSKNGNNLLKELIQKCGGIDFTMPVFTGYTGMDDTLLKGYLEDSKEIWQDAMDVVPEIVIGSTIGTHVGPGAIAVAFVEKF